MISSIIKGLTATLTDLVIDRSQNLSQEKTLEVLRKNLSRKQLDIIEIIINRPETYCDICLLVEKHKCPFQ